MSPNPCICSQRKILQCLTMQLLFRGILYASLLRTILLNTYTVIDICILFNTIIAVISYQLKMITVLYIPRL